MKVEFSVVIPAFNAARYLRQSLGSVLEQTYPPLDIFVIDDGSEDETSSVARAVDPRVIVVRQSNQGVSSARNRGFELARGSHIAWLDADDAWKPNKLEEFASMLTERPEASFAFSDYQTIGEDSQRVSLKGAIDLWESLRLLLVPTVTVLPSAAVTRKSTRMRFPVWAGNDSEDSIYFNELAREAPFVHIPQALTDYRRHRESAQAGLNSRERACENLWRYYGEGEGKSSRDALIETFLYLARYRLGQGRREEYRYYCRFLRSKLALGEQPFMIRQPTLYSAFQLSRRAFFKIKKLVRQPGVSS